MSVGHTDKPTELEAKYIKMVMKSSDFKYNPEELEGISPMILIPIKSSILPKILKSPDVIKPGQNLPEIDKTPKLEKLQNSYLENSSNEKKTTPKLEEYKSEGTDMKVHHAKKKFGITLHAT
jgi:hypothetical protein